MTNSTAVVSLVLAALTGLVGCASAVPVGATDAIASDSTPPGLDAGDPAVACANVAAGGTYATSEGDLVSRLAGTWTQCGSDSVFGTYVPDAAGFVFAGDHTWQPLVRAAGGGMTPMAGPRGTWETVPVGGSEHVQLNLNYGSGGGIIPHPQFSGSTVSMNNNGVYRGVYARVP